MRKWSLVYLFIACCVISIAFGQHRKMFENENVGIGLGSGTNVPAERLHIRGNARIDSASPSGYNQYLNASGLTINDASSLTNIYGLGAAGTITANPFGLMTSNAERWRVGAGTAGSDTGALYPFNDAIYRLGLPDKRILEGYFVGVAITNGNVGIGTTAPVAPLHIVATSGNFFTGQRSNASAVTSFYNLWNNATNNGNGAWIGFSTDTIGTGATVNKSFARIGAVFDVHDDGTSASSLGFDTRISGTLTRVMTISSNGNVGIGTTTPLHALQVAGNTHLDGGQFIKIFTTNASYTLSTNFHVFEWNAAAVAGTITLPAATSCSNWTGVIKDIGGNAFATNITIAPASGTIDGAASVLLNGNYAAKTIYSSGSRGWFTR